MTFSPFAWLKLQWFLHAGDTEVGGFGISAEDDLLYVTDFATVRQYTTEVTVEFEDGAVADYFDTCVDAGLTPSRFARIWCHTHPGDSPDPSGTDERTFARVFGDCDWSVMFICSRTGRTDARLSFSAGPGGELLLPVTVDWAAWPTLDAEKLAFLPDQWRKEFDQNVIPAIFSRHGESSESRDLEMGRFLGFSHPGDMSNSGAFAAHEQQANDHAFSDWFDQEPDWAEHIIEREVIL